MGKIDTIELAYAREMGADVLLKWLKQLKLYFDPPQTGDVEFKYYIRTGDCNQCGQCCNNIYLIHHEEIIKTVETFDLLKKRFEDYAYFVPIETDSIGVRFRCSNLLEDNTCAIHDDRPLFCKKYPSEDSLLMGGRLAPECSYVFKIKQSFSEVMKEMEKKKHLRPGRLENDVFPEKMISPVPQTTRKIG